MKSSDARIRVAVAIIGLALVAFIVWSTMGLAGYTVEVCMDYKSRTNCGTASGTSREEALRTATDLACATISSGVSETIGCANMKPSRISWIDE